jgi:hypothetical protein
MFSSEEIYEFLFVLRISDDHIPFDLRCIEKVDRLSAEQHKEIGEVHPIVPGVGFYIQHLESGEKR